jgi:hypothetical protein
MFRSVMLFVALVVGAGVAAHAQAVRTPVAPQPLDMKNFETAMMAAQAAAIKTGDETLGCEALQKELVSTMTDPAIQAYAAKTNAALAKDLTAKDKTRAAMTPETAAALAASLNPAMMMAGLNGAGGLVPGQQMTPQQMQQVMMAQMQAVAAIMPAMMRTQRVTQLAMVKNCTWATGAGLGLYPGTVRPGVVLPQGTGLPPGTVLPR